jgi:hypothetical protein
MIRLLENALRGLMPESSQRLFLWLKHPSLFNTSRAMSALPPFLRRGFFEVKEESKMTFVGSQCWGSRGGCIKPHKVETNGLSHSFIGM